MPTKSPMKPQPPSKNGHSIAKPLPPPASNQHTAEKIRIQPALVSQFSTQFADLIIASKYQGRFYALKVMVHEEVVNAKENEFRVVHPTVKMRTDDKERQAFMHACYSMFQKTKLDWIVRWSDKRKLFVLLRKPDWEKIKEKGLVGGL